MMQQLFSGRPCAYQNVDPLANWQASTGYIRLAVGRR